jgi:uncharacterized protein YggE
VKPQHFAILAGSLLVIGFLLVWAGKPAPTSPPMVPSPDHLVTVVGDGEVRPKPDLVLLTFGIMTQGPSASEADGLGLATVGRLKAVLVTAGADESSLEILPTGVKSITLPDSSGAMRMTGYQAQFRLNAKVALVTKVQAVIDAGLGVGNTTLDKIAYTLEKPEAVKQAALKEALANARIRADAMAQADGGKLGALQSMEAQLEETPPVALSPNSLVVSAHVKATFGY